MWHADLPIILNNEGVAVSIDRPMGKGVDYDLAFSAQLKAPSPGDKLKSIHTCKPY